jgi:hypothetical protein
MSGQFRLGRLPPVTPYQRVKHALHQHVSPIQVASVLASALEHLEIESEEITDENLSAVVEAAMVGLRLFVAPEQLPSLQEKLAEALEGLK